MTQSLTLIGPLAEPALTAALGLTGRPVVVAGRLTGGARAGLARDGWPAIGEHDDLLPGLEVEDSDRLARYAAITGLAPVRWHGRMLLGVAAGDTAPQADAGGPWPAELAAEVARDLLARPVDRPTAELARRLPMIASQVASRQRARAERGAPLAPGPAQADRLRLESRREAYAAHFSVEEHRLRHRLHRGGWSDPLDRAVFVSGDAVVVLPWDPVRDRVLLVDQFRAGPAVRGDGQPWLLEPVAGRIDAGETPESTARREAEEEAGVTLGAMFAALHHYPTPGIAAEYLYAFVGVADLPDDSAIVTGLPDEGEDIRGHLVSRAELTRMALDGRIVNGPLLILALWLDRQADALRAGRVDAVPSNPGRPGAGPAVS